MKKLAALFSFAVFVGFHGLLQAAEISSELAQQAVDVWLKRGQPVQGVTDSAKTVVDSETGARINVVTLKGGGYVITAGDDLRGPVMAFSQSGTFDPDPENPMWLLVKGDARLSPAETNSPRRLSSAASDASRTDEQFAWDDLLGRGDVAKRSSGNLPSGSVIRCAPMIDTVWGQSTHNNYREEDGGLPCYNYYTPVDVEYVENNAQKSSSREQVDNGIAANMSPESYRSPCGCVATAGAQLIRYHKYPSSAKAGTFQCTAFSVSTNMHVSGASYKWSDMENNPSKRHSERCRQAIGRLTADVGISCGSSYGRSQTSAGIWSTYKPCLMNSLTDTFKYAQAKWFSGYRAADFQQNAIPNFDARKPIVISVYDHALLADGYAWDSEAQGTLYIHVNMGWYGKSDGWYVPPKIASYSSILGFLGNIFTKETGYIVSGRVIGADGRPVRDAEVRLKDHNSILATSTKTDAQGVYYLIYKYYLSSNYSLEAICGGMSRSIALDPDSTSGNALRDITLPVSLAVSDPVVTCDNSSYPVRVTMSCATPDALIRYTTNRSVPTEENSKLYTGPFDIYGSKTFKVRAFKSGYQSSAVVLHQYDHGSRKTADSFSNAPSLSTSSGEIELSNVGATTESGEPSLLDGHSLWLSFTASETAYYSFAASATSSDGDALNVVCAAYEGSSISSLSQKAAAYDGISLKATKGTTYKIAIDTADGTGDIAFSWRKSDVVQPDKTIVPATTSEAGIGTVTIHSTTTWEAVDCPDWVTLLKSSGSDGEALRYSYSRNAYSDIRSGVITLRAGDSDDVGISVYQLGDGWCITKSAAEAAALATGKRIVLVYGRDGCYNTRSVRDFLSSNAEIHAIVEKSYVLWFCNYDGDMRMEGNSYFSGMTDFNVLPGLAIIDASNMSSYVARKSGYQYASNLKTFLQTYAPADPKPVATVTMSFDANGGIASFSSKSYIVGSTYGTLPTATRSGYTFDGWYTLASGGTKILATSTASSSLTKLYAHWTAIAATYTITFDANGGTGGTTITRKAGECLGTLPTPTRVGYKLVGWQVRSSLVVIPDVPDSVSSDSIGLLPFLKYKDVELTASTVVSGDITYYAKWQAITYTVRFSSNGGSGTMADQTFTYDVQQALTANGFTKKTSSMIYKFDRWLRTNGGTSYAYSDGQVVKNLSSVDGAVVVLTASWSVDRIIVPIVTETYSVRFHYNNGSSDITRTQSINVGTATALADKGTGGWTNPSGKTFLGWATSAGSGVVKFWNSARVTDLTTAGKTYDLYAIWYNAKTDYRVRYHRNGGSSDATTTLQRFAKGATTRLAWMDGQLGWKRTGYVFLGWGKTAKATVATYANGENVKDLASVGQIVDLYAVWRPANSHVITFHRNVTSGDSVTARQWIAGGVSTRLAWKDSALGWAPAAHTFLGWAESPSGAVKYANGQYVKDLAAANATKHLYARWAANKYKVRFHYNYNTDKTADQSFTYGTEQRLTYLDSGLKWAHPLSASFLGWSTSADGDVKYANGAKVKNLTSTNNGVIHLYAKWSLITVVYHRNAGVASEVKRQWLVPNVTQSLLWLNSQLGWKNPAGKALVGWSTSQTATIAQYANGARVKNLAAAGKTVHLYAVWGAIASNYTICYYRNYTSADTTCAYQLRSLNGWACLAWKDSQLGWATPSGKTFLGWSMTRSDTLATYANGMRIPAIAADGATVSLYAIWGTAKKSAVRGGIASTSTSSTPTPNTYTYTPGYYRGAFADGSGTFDLLLDEFDDDGVATAYFVAATASGTWSVECEATVVGDELLIVLDGRKYAMVCDVDDGYQVKEIEK